MTGRRRHPRYLLNQPSVGTLRVREEVSIEGIDQGEVVVLSGVPYRPGEIMHLELPTLPPRRLTVRVEESRPVMVPDEGVRHRLRLSIQPAAEGGGGNGSGQP
jgi:hypothetical protein